MCTWLESGPTDQPTISPPRCAKVRKGLQAPTIAAKKELKATEGHPRPPNQLSKPHHHFRPRPRLPSISGAVPLGRDLPAPRPARLRPNTHLAHLVTTKSFRGLPLFWDCNRMRFHRMASLLLPQIGSSTLPMQALQPGCGPGWTRLCKMTMLRSCEPALPAGNSA